MFKIGEFSRITQVSVRMLRYYNEQQLLIPNVVDPFSGYRFYSAEQINSLNQIILLRNMGFGVKEMKDFLQSENKEKLNQMLLEQIQKTEENIRVEQNRLRQLHGYLDDYQKQNQALNIQIVMKPIEKQQVMSLRRIVPNYYCESELWGELGEQLGMIKDLETYESFSIYHDLDYREEEVDIEVCLVVKEPLDLPATITRRTVEQVDMAACFMIYGPYSNISIAYKEFAFWLEQHREYYMAGENRQICHVSMCHTTNPKEYITELQIPLGFRTES